MSGTSMATPMVTGAAALMLAANKKLTAAQLKGRLIDGSDETTTLNNRTVSDGQIDLANSIANAPARTSPTTAAASARARRARDVLTGRGRSIRAPSRSMTCWPAPEPAAGTELPRGDEPGGFVLHDLLRRAMRSGTLWNAMEHRDMAELL
jgi:subtilisin family serine protease